MENFLDKLTGYPLHSSSTLIPQFPFITILRRFMIQTHISKDPSGQIAYIFPYDPLFLNKVPIHPAINGNCTQRQLLTSQTFPKNMTWILRRPVNNFSTNFKEDIVKLVCHPLNSLFWKTNIE